jgi:hypothetical protein
LLAKPRFGFNNPLEFSGETEGADEIRGSLKGKFLGISTDSTLGPPFELTVGRIQRILDVIDR